MLKRLVLRDFVIVTSLDVELGDGFTVLTGETGAGKSILIDALQLALGGRGDVGVIREGCSRTEITAEFEPVPETVLTWLDEAGFSAEASLMIRRTLDVQGKSRVWINGSPATVTQARELGEQLVDIHGQHAWQSLTRPASVRALLDDYAQVDTSALHIAWTRWNEARQALSQAQSQGEALNRERERLSWQIGEIDKLAPGEHEWDELNLEHQRLSHAQGILDALQTALDAISEGEVQAEQCVDRAVDALGPVAGYDPQLANALEVLTGVQAQLSDAAHSLNAALRRTELDPDRLEALDARLGSWMSLARRYRRSPEELPTVLAGWKHELAALDAAGDLEQLQATVRATRVAFDHEAARVSRLRRQAAPRLSAAITEAMQTLGMAGGRFEVALAPLAEPQSWGLEGIEFLVAGHTGSTPRPVGKVASGGELSRIALAIAVTTRQSPDAGGRSGAATLIFDEVDSGVGGTVADTVGQRMRRLGEDRQVMAVTHLAQVAACAHHHWVVSKSPEGGSTHSEIRAVNADTREQEIARMLGAQAGSQAGLAHAREMLARAAAEQAAPAPTAKRPRR